MGTGGRTKLRDTCSRSVTDVYTQSVCYIVKYSTTIIVVFVLSEIRVCSIT